MKISPATKISVLIKANPAAIDAIASISSHFEKLRNPLLRKILASRVTIADAARIGGSSVAVFFEKLEAIGFEPEGISDQQPKTKTEEKMTAVTIPENTVELDVREALKSGHDPFTEIMDAVKELNEDQALKLINTFEPTPLIAILKKRGYSHQTETVSDKLIHTYFYKSDEAPQATEKPAAAPDNLKFSDLVEKYAGKLQEVDVRQLEMPLPMTTILETLPKLKPEEALFVHHKKVPQYLLPQLQERGYGYAVNKVEDNEVKLIIYKK